VWLLGSTRVVADRSPESCVVRILDSEASHENMAVLFWGRRPARERENNKKLIAGATVPFRNESLL
jgi:hypothetical protein